MKTLSPALLTHIQSEVTSIRTCWKATLGNGTVYGFTDHTQNLTVNGQLYSATTGYAPSAIVSNSSLAVDNLEVMGMLDSAVIEDVDIQAGLWDFAQVEIFQVNATDLSQGIIRQHFGRLGEVSINRNSFVAELRGLAQQMQQTIGELYSPTCRANLGDVRCGVNLVPFTVTGTVTANVDNKIFTDTARTEGLAYFDGGKLTWTSGQNTGLSMEIKAFSSNQFTLQLPMPFTINIGDAYSAYPGCKKRFMEDCKAKFNNTINFRGEPHVPGSDKVSAVGGL